MSRTTTTTKQSATGPQPVARRRRTATALAVVTTFGLVPILALVNGGPSASAARSRIPNASLSPTGVSITAGSSVDLAIRLSSAKPSNLTASLKGQPTGVTGAMSCESARDCTLQLTAAASAPAATDLVYVMMRSGSLSRAIPIAVHVQPVTVSPPPTTAPPTVPTTAQPPTTTGVNRTLSLRPETFNETNRSGARSTFVINVVRNGWNDPVDMTIEGLPTGWRAAFLVNPAIASTTLVLDSPVDAKSGEYPIRISGKSGSVVAESVVVVRLKPVELSLSMVTPGTSVSPGGAARFVVNTRSLDDNRPVTLRVEGLPSGATATILPNPVSGNSNVDVALLGSVAPANYGFQIVAVLDGVEVRLAAVLLVAAQYTSTFQFTPTPVTAIPGQNRGYGLASPSGSVTAPAGGFVSFDVGVSPIGGFADIINMSLVPPTGWSISWVAVSPNLARVTVGPPANTAKGPTVLELRTASGTLAASLTITANVT
jgi:hypothetical protein